MQLYFVEMLRLTSFLSHTSMSYRRKNSILLSRILSLSTFITWRMGSVCVCLSSGGRLHKNDRIVATKALLVLYCVIYSAEPCWVVFCRKAAVRPWWPWWFCRRSSPAAESQHRSATWLLCLRRVNTASQPTGKRSSVGHTAGMHAVTFTIQ